MASIRVADPMLPALAAEFGGRPSEMAPAITLFALAYGAMQLVWGPLGDRLGPLRIIAWGAITASAGSLACALAPSLQALSVARLVTGGCCAAIIPLAIAHVGNTVSDERRQATLARLATGTLTGMIAGQLLGGLSADTLGWRTGFAILALLFLLTGGAVLRMQSRQARLPPTGPLTAASMLRSWRLVLGDGWARTVLAAAALEGALVFGALAFVPSWLHARTGMSLSAAGAVVAALGLGGLAYSMSAGRWIGLLGRRRMLTVGGLLLAVGFCALPAIAAAIPVDGPLWITAFGACALGGFGFYMLHNTMQTLATQLAPAARATAVGLFAVALFAGQSMGVALASALGALVGHERVLVGAGLILAALMAALGWATTHRRG